MVKKHKPKQGGSAFVMTIISGIAISLLISLLMTMLTAAAITQEWIPESSLEYIVYFISGFAIIPGAIFSCKRIAGKYMVVSLAVILTYLFILIAANIIFFDGIFHGIGLLTVSLILGGAVSCYVASLDGSRRRRRSVRF